MGTLPVQPPKPRVVKLGDTWVLDTGHSDVLHDSWADAIRHAERICGDYVRRLSLWVAMNGSSAPPHTELCGVRRRWNGGHCTCSSEREPGVSE